MRQKYPSVPFSRQELQAFATAGVRERIRTIERELHRLQKEFPGLFVTDAPLVLLAPEPRSDGTTWQPLVTPEPNGTKPRSDTYSEQKRHRRTASARLLAHFSPDTPRPLPDGDQRAITILLRHGYLKRVGVGSKAQTGKGSLKGALFIRTAKEFVI